MAQTIFHIFAQLCGLITALSVRPFIFPNQCFLHWRIRFFFLIDEIPPSTMYPIHSAAPIKITPLTEL